MSQARTPKAPSFSQKNHSGETCSLGLRSIFHLSEREETQHNQKVFGCRICLKRFHFSANLQKHQKQHMEEKFFSNAAVRALFVKSCKCHVSRKPFTYEEVGKDFLATLGHLQPHTTHTREKPNRIVQREATLQSRESHYSWGECKKAFSPKHALVQDQSVLPGRHCFVCSECGKTFRIHTGERPFECSECWKSFSHQSYLTQHWKVHSGKRPYECSECGKSYTSHPEFTLEIGLISAVNVGSLFSLVPTSIIIREFTQQKGLMSAVNVGNVFPVIPSFMNIREFTQGKGLMSARNVGSSLEQILLSLNTVEVTLERSLINAVNVGNLFHLDLVSVIIREFTQDWGHMRVVNVGNLFPRALHSFNIRVHRGERP
ncbi:zinc finger protein 256-like [Physeter macrocephalus]|uniref:Zinc finger protein 256-like n=1 Tax=Physeter macrocephalus TaxID=9755 RepID=A0A9W2W7U1_PHYMC|nr:zinc finger protein 256-like [Physeter catodon]